MPCRCKEKSETLHTETCLAGVKVNQRLSIPKICLAGVKKNQRLCIPKTRLAGVKKNALPCRGKEKNQRLYEYQKHVWNRCKKNNNNQKQRGGDSALLPTVNMLQVSCEAHAIGSVIVCAG